MELTHIPLALLLVISHYTNKPKSSCLIDELECGNIDDHKTETERYI